jgi:hypothetical protein
MAASRRASRSSDGSVACEPGAVEGEAEPVGGGTLVVDGRGGHTQGFDDLRRVADPAQGGLHLDVLAGLQAGSIDLACFMAGEVELAGQCPGVPAEAVAVGPVPGEPIPGDGLGGGGVSGGGVELPVEQAPERGLSLK